MGYAFGIALVALIIKGIIAICRKFVQWIDSISYKSRQRKQQREIQQKIDNVNICLERLKAELNKPIQHTITISGINTPASINVADAGSNRVKTGHHEQKEYTIDIDGKKTKIRNAFRLSEKEFQEQERRIEALYAEHQLETEKSK
jgi:hypothetical protein